MPVWVNHGLRSDTWHMESSCVCCGGLISCCRRWRLAVIILLVMLGAGVDVRVLVDGMWGYRLSITGSLPALRPGAGRTGDGGDRGLALLVRVTVK
jgi:hypothetical protein